MSCIHSTFFDCKCSLYDEDVPSARPSGCHEDGTCLVDGAENPGSLCHAYESDWACAKCGADFNLEEECNCD